MNSFLESVFHWTIAEFILSAILFFNYRLFSAFVKNSTNRYTYLRLSFIALLALPFYPFHLALSEYKMLPANAVMSFAMRGFSQYQLRGPEALPIVHFIPAILGAVYLAWLGFICIKIIFSLMEIKDICKKSSSSDEKFRWPVLLCEHKNIGPMTVGIFKPKIILSRALFNSLSKEDLTLVLTHEFIHANRRDGLFNLLRIFVKDALIFSPFCNELSRLYEETMEISVDTAVLEDQSISARDYARLILSLVDPRPNHTNRLSAIHISNSCIHQRIASMKNPVFAKKNWITTQAILLFTLIGSVSVSFLINREAYAKNSDAFLVRRYEAFLYQCTHGNGSCEFIMDTGIAIPSDQNDGPSCNCHPQSRIDQWVD